MAEKNVPNRKDEDPSNQNNVDNTHPLEERELEKLKKLIESQEFENEGQVNSYLNNLMHSGRPLPEVEPETALEAAQQIAYDAMEAPTRKASISLARKALKTSPDCADAYVILAEEYATTLEEAIYYYKAGVEAGKRAIGVENFKKLYGHFWGELDTRPYMRALSGLAGCLWEVGKRQEALQNYKSLLRLNPNDNQGIRYILAARLLEMGNIEALKKLLGKYNEGSASWLYTKALVMFIEQGDSSEAKQSLRMALSYNRYVVPYLTGHKHLPGRLPVFSGYGDRNEAIYYAAEYGRGWLRTKGAIDWIISISSENQKRLAADKVEGVPEVFLKAFPNEDKKNAIKEKTEQIYTFRVDLKYAPGIWRKIEIKGTQSLHHLHQIIVEAFERDDDHLYAFFMNNVAWDNSAEYGPPYGETDARNSMKAKINSLGLQNKSKFLYIFDFGDDWEHPLTLLSIRQETPTGKFPRIVGFKGDAPPQYPDSKDE